ncbi:unnamed protein product, partial [Prorocentrum cordatum]
MEASTIGLSGANFIDELLAALQDDGVGAPPGLATATLVVGTPALANFTVPVARWVARTPWSLCSNMCGPGERTRMVECVGAWGNNGTDLCNANAAPGFTMESYMPDSEPCEQYTSCAYDWSCPSGPDPVTGEGCETQASGVAIGIAVAFLCFGCLLCQYIRRSKRALEDKLNDMLGFKRTNIYWEDEDGREETTDSISHQLFYTGQAVEYWSKPHQTWLPANILAVKETQYYDNALKFYALSFDVSTGSAEQKVHGVDMMNLRVPFVHGELVSVFSQKYGKWFPARIHESWYDVDTRIEYDVMLEDVFDDYLGTYVLSELQKDLERHCIDRGENLPALKKIPAKRLRRRYNSGDRVRVYRGADEGFVE